MASDWTELVKRVAAKMTDDKDAAAMKVLSTPRGHGKSMLADFLSTPGYSTEEAARYSSHDEYMKELRRREAERKQAEPAGSTIIQHGDWLHMEEKEVVVEGSDELLSLAELALEVTEYMKAHPDSFMLTEPAALTIKRGDGQYSKRAHIGGEDFKASHVYVGKRKKLICVFNPVMVSDYAEMEMEEADARKMLTGFEQYIRGASSGEFDRIMKERKKAVADAAEREKLAGREEQYADLGFGSW